MCISTYALKSSEIIVICTHACAIHFHFCNDSNTTCNVDVLIHVYMYKDLIVF